MVKQFLQLNGKILVDKNGLPLRAETPDIIRSESDPSNAEASNYADGTIWIKTQNGKPVKSWVKDSYEDKYRDNYAAFFAFGILDENDVPIFPITADALKKYSENEINPNEFAEAINAIHNISPTDSIWLPENVHSHFKVYVDSFSQSDMSVSCDSTGYRDSYDLSLLTPIIDNFPETTVLCGFFNYTNLQALKEANGEIILSGDWASNDLVWGMYINPMLSTLTHPLVLSPDAQIRFENGEYSFTSILEDRIGFRLNNQEKVFLLEGENDMTKFFSFAMGGNSIEENQNLWSQLLSTNVGFQSFQMLLDNSTGIFIAPFGAYEPSTKVLTHIWRD